MTKGGFRIGAGRKRGARDIRTWQLENGLIETGVDNFVGKITSLDVEQTKPAEIKTTPPQRRLFATPVPLGYSLGSAELFKLSGFELKGQTAVPARFLRAFYPATNNPPAIISMT